MRNNAALIAIIALISSSCLSCAPTYPREKIIEGVKNLCKKEYKVDVEVKIVGKTLGVRIPLEGLFDLKTMQISKAAFDKLDGVMLSVSRVALSCDKSIDFYTVITSDKGVPGAEVVMTRYVGDLTRFAYEDISRGEFAKRMVFDVRFNPQGIIDIWTGDFTLKETTLDEFICEQASRRIMDDFRDDKMLAGKFKVVSCDGRLASRVFKFEVDVSREGLPMSELIHGSAWHEGVVDLCIKTAAHVVHIYNFKEYDTIEVHNKFDNKVKKIRKEEINKWRNRRIKIE